MRPDDAYDVLDLKALRCFWAVARHGSLTRAGIELGISESAISQRVKALETYLGTRLYESPGGRVRLTEAGQRVREMAIGLFDRLEQFTADLAAEEQAGTLVVAAEEPTLRYLLPGVIQRFRRERPRVRLQVVSRLVGEIIEMVRQGEADLGIIPQQHPLPEIVRFVSWRSFEAYLVLPKDHPLVRRGRPPLRALLNAETVMRYPLIIPETTAPRSDRVGLALAREGLPYNIAFQVGSMDTVKHYVASGLGLGVVLGMCLTEEDAGRLEAIEIPPEFGGTTVYGVVLRRDKYLSASLRGFTGLLPVAMPA